MRVGAAGRGGGDGGVYTFQLPEIRDQVQTQVISIVPHFKRREFLFRCITDGLLDILEDVSQGVAAVKGLSEIMFGLLPWAREVVAEVTE